MEEQANDVPDVALTGVEPVFTLLKASSLVLADRSLLIHACIQEPESAPEFLILEVELPALVCLVAVLKGSCQSIASPHHPFCHQTSTATVVLDVAQDCVRLHARPDVYFLQLELEHAVDANATMAQFNRYCCICTVS
jgi:hypothetical protein